MLILGGLGPKLTPHPEREAQDVEAGLRYVRDAQTRFRGLGFRVYNVRLVTVL